LKNRLVKLENYFNFDLTTFSSSASNSAVSQNDVARLEELIESKEKIFVKTILGKDQNCRLSCFQALCF